MQQWQRAGIHHLRIEFVHETADQVRDIVQAFQHHPYDLEPRLKRFAPEGLTEGSLFTPKSDPVFRIL
ncbi:MAG: hypothetical protein FJW36_04875 [Acidobacteria bacterium]|nr:hypothetical protein [Acidobacteriota bacterium]